MLKFYWFVLMPLVPRALAFIILYVQRCMEDSKSCSEFTSPIACLTNKCSLPNSSSDHLGTIQVVKTARVIIHCASRSSGVGVGWI